MKPSWLILSLVALGFLKLSPVENALAGPNLQPSFDCRLSRLALALQPKPADSAQLDAVLKKLDETAAAFNTAQAEFEWDRYEKVIDEVDDVQAGTIYYRRSGKDEVEMKVDVKMAGASATALKPEPKFVLLSGGKIRVYQPKADQVTLYDLGKNRSDFETYLVLGFGGSGQDLVKQFDVIYLGQETVGGVATAKLQLVPKSERVRNNFKQFILWIDLEKGISVQQQIFEPQGDYRLSKYSSIQLNKKIPDDVFKLKTTSKTQTISPGS
ncbi:MAG TPA: outer membrane lipoprotein carrier protein LolA [Candidatus Solibacter sp.]|nr:outer membrane lipoprotein carrier protein LolA [Candidatus Solibacter sp.]